MESLQIGYFSLDIWRRDEPQTSQMAALWQR